MEGGCFILHGMLVVPLELQHELFVKSVILPYESVHS